ncbi:sialin-like [Olea europaea subsp. europaea]|uniref:Sialin-like n=1 Tax=Olea europaea subsp. europaea TaxID=158383 RepID=A0A8S0QB79_OLEEU|nr:sialin-like [Olea europaea subsp. europaea]
MATPWMARTSLTLLAASRVLMGVLQSGAHPATYALINRWLPMSEASIFAPMIKMSVGIGQLSASLIPGLILKWPNVFYVISALGIGWSIIWLIVATSDPSTNRWVSKAELAHIMKEKKNFKLDESSNKIAKKKTPWLKIITSPSVIGLIIAKLTYNFCSDWLNVELPSYLKYVHHAPIQKISAITTAMFVVQVSSVLPAGWLAKVCVQKKPWGLSKTSTRKIFESISTVGSTILLILIIFNGCNLTYVTVYLMLIGLVSTFEAGGDTMLPYDLSEEYPATILSIALCIGNLSGIAVTTLTSFVLGDQGGSQARWHTLIALIAAFVFAGGLVFCLMIKAKPIDFESKKKQSANENIESASTDRSQVDSIDSV